MKDEMMINCEWLKDMRQRGRGLIQYRSRGEYDEEWDDDKLWMVKRHETRRPWPTLIQK